MAHAPMGRDRISLDVRPEEHRRIKASAVLHGQSIRQYVLESVWERLRTEREAGDLSTLTGALAQDPVLKRLWENDRDAAYDNL